MPPLTQHPSYKVLAYVLVLLSVHCESSLFQRAKTYKLQEIFAPLAPDEERKYPAPMNAAVPVLRGGDTMAIITLYRGQERPDVVKIWERDLDRFRLSTELSVVEYGLGSYETPRVFTVQNEQLILIQFTYSGSSYSHDDTVFVVHPNGDLQRVMFRPAPIGCESVLKSKESTGKSVLHTFANDTMKFEFYVWNEGDAHCCPTAGKVSGTYKLVKERAPGKSVAQYRIVVDSFQRTPIGSK